MIIALKCLYANSRNNAAQHCFQTIQFNCYIRNISVILLSQSKPYIMGFLKSIINTLVIILLTGCSQIETPQINDGQKENDNGHLKRAIDVANDILGQMDGATRSPRIIKEVQTHRANGLLTRTDENDAEFYIINYADDQGFALVSVDSEDEAVYGFSNQGNLCFSDTLTNPAFKEYLAAVAGIDTKPIYPHDSITYTPAFKVLVAPLLTYEVRNWDQMSLNKYIKLKYGQDYPVGCVALSCAQIMSNNRWPDKWPVNGYSSATEKYTFDWETMRNKRVDDQTARLLEILGRSQNLSITYRLAEEGGSSASMSSIGRTFKNLGYYNPTTVSFNTDIALEELYNSSPIIISGYASGSFGHCWVIDGACQSQLVNSIVGQAPQYNLYYHFIWGNWGGCNGYFYYDTSTKKFDMDPAYRDESESNSHGTGEIYRSQQMVYNFRVNPISLHQNTK